MRLFQWMSVALLVMTVGVAWGREGEERTLRCNGGLAEVGQSEYDVVEKCGPPRAVEFSGTGRVLVYDFGPGTFVYYVYVSDGKVESIRSGDYGTQAPTK